MKIIYLQNSNEHHAYLMDVFHRMGNELSIYQIADSEEQILKAFGEGKLDLLAQEMKVGKSDAVFGLGYSACIAELCHSLNLIYISWLLQPPFSEAYSATVIYSTNRIFVADKYIADLFNMQGITNIFYLPAGVNIEKCRQVGTCYPEAELWDAAVADTISKNGWHELFRTENLKDSTLGYLEGILTCQNLVYGYDFYQRPMPGYVLEDLKRNSAIVLPHDSVEDISDYYADQCFYPKTTEKDRVIGVKTLEKGGMSTHYFSDQPIEGENLIQHSPVSLEERLKVYARTKINLCIAPRGIRDGLCESLLYAMAMGAFVITDYKPHVTEELNPDENVIVYEDLQDLLNKAKYFFIHDEERKKIAENARVKIEQEHTMEHRVEFILKKL